MKKIFLSVIGTLFTTSLFAQWTSSGSDIYNTTTAGKVGIGGLPAFKLSVFDTKLATYSSDSTLIPAVYISNLNNSTAANQYTSLALRTGVDGGSHNSLAFITLVNTTGSHNGDLAFTLRKDKTQYYERMRITSGGNVGIGTTMPDAVLTIAKEVTPSTGTTYPVKISTGSGSFSGFLAERTDIAQFAAVGVGTTNTLLKFSNGRFSVSAESYATKYNTGSGTELFTVLNTGNVGIGTTVPDAKLAVAGNIHAKEVKVSPNVPGPDYVFDANYKLTGLDEVKAYVEKYHHLPEIPSAKQMEKNGINLGDMNMKLLKKVEELTLYTVSLKEENSQLKSEQQKKNDEQEKRIAALEKALSKLTNQ